MTAVPVLSWIKEPYDFPSSYLKFSLVGKVCFSSCTALSRKVCQWTSAVHVLLVIHLFNFLILLSLWKVSMATREPSRCCVCVIVCLLWTPSLQQCLFFQTSIPLLSIRVASAQSHSTWNVIVGLHFQRLLRATCYNKIYWEIMTHSN